MLTTRERKLQDDNYRRHRRTLRWTKRQRRSLRNSDIRRTDYSTFSSKWESIWVAFQSQCHRTCLMTSNLDFVYSGLLGELQVNEKWVLLLRRKQCSRNYVIRALSLQLTIPKQLPDLEQLFFLQSLFHAI